MKVRLFLTLSILSLLLSSCLPIGRQEQYPLSAIEYQDAESIDAPVDGYNYDESDIDTDEADNYAERRADFYNFHREQLIFVSLQQELDPVLEATLQLSAMLDLDIEPEDLDVILHTFCFLDFVTPEQFGIARGYLRDNLPDDSWMTTHFGIDYENFLFIDQMLVRYINEVMSVDELRHYDALDMSDMPDNPRRILTRMYEGLLISASELRRDNAPAIFR